MARPTVSAAITARIKAEAAERYKQDPKGDRQTIFMRVLEEEIGEEIENQVQVNLIEAYRSGVVTSNRSGGFHHEANEPTSRKARRSLSALGTSPNEYNKNADGVVYDKDSDFSGLPMGMLFGDIAMHDQNRLEAAGRKRMNKMIEVTNAFSSNVPSGGGFLIPEQMRSDIISLSLGEAIVRPRATVMPMSSLTLGVPTIDETSRVSNIYGGMVFGWAEESETLAASNPRFGRVTLRAQKGYWYANIPNELLDDGPALTVWLEARLPGFVAFSEDRAFLRGTGVGQPLGVFNAGARIAVTRTTASKIKYPDILNMLCRMYPAGLDNAVWLANPDTIPQLMSMVQVVQNVAASENVGGAPVFVLNAQGDRPISIFGRPLIFTEHASALGAEADLSFIDFRQYLVGDRMTMQVKTSEHIRFQNDETAFRMIERVDGRPWLPQSLTPEFGTNTLSPYVVLAA